MSRDPLVFDLNDPKDQERLLQMQPKSGAPFTQYLVNQLEEIRRNWKLEAARFEQFRRAVQREIDIAESIISDAGHVSNLLNDPQYAVARERFLATIDTAERFLANARDEYCIRIGINYSKDQRERGRKGGEKRWAGYRTLESVYRALAERTDELGDPVPSNELWPELYSFLDDKKLNPAEIEHEADIQKDVIRWSEGYIEDGDSSHKISAGKITRGTFKNRISDLRQELKS